MIVKIIALSVMLINKNSIEKVKSAVQACFYSAIYNPKKFFGYLAVVLGLFFCFVGLLYYKKSANQDNLVDEVKIMQEFMQNGKNINVDKIEALKLKTPNIFGSLLAFNLINRASVVEIDEIEKTKKLAKKLNVDLLTIANIQYACAIAFINVLKNNNTAENQNRVFDELKNIRAEIVSLYNKNKKQDLDFFDVLQSQLDTNILSSLRFFSVSQQEYFLSSIKTSNYIVNVKVTQDKQYTNQIINLHK